MLDGDPALLQLGEDRFLERLQSYVDLAPALRERVPDIDYVDLRFDERIYVRPVAATRKKQDRSSDGGEGVSENAQCRPDGLREQGDLVARKERYLVGLDVGTSKVTAIVGEMTRRRRARHRRHRRRRVARHPARRRRQPRGGGRIDQEGDRRSRADGRRRDRLGAPRRCPGAHVKAFNSRGVVAVAGKNREITREDVRRAIDAAKAVALPTGREILHVLPQDFVVDEQDGIGAPVGMTGARLEVNVHIVTGSAERRRRTSSRA